MGAAGIKNDWKCPNCPKCGANRTRIEHTCSDLKRDPFDGTQYFDCANTYICGWKDCGFEWSADDEDRA